ncbi:MAG: hypothetical protein CMQ19_05595 [Gammaproteobacteria bacterium]|nr:hypothetical protein [Gammaproteobacteria bacterium]
MLVRNIKINQRLDHTSIRVGVQNERLNNGLTQLAQGSKDLISIGIFQIPIQPCYSSDIPMTHLSRDGNPWVCNLQQVGFGPGTAVAILNNTIYDKQGSNR